MAKYRRLYLARVCSGPDDMYELGTAKKDFDPEKGFKSEHIIDEFCPEEFERATSIKMKPGEIRKVKINIEFLD